MKGLLIVLCALGLGGCQEPPPKVMAPIAPFSLTAASGETFTSDSLVGQPHIASFFFTSCGTICPQVMGGVRGALDEAKRRGVSLKAISITVDPVTDTPAHLVAYAAKEGIADQRWTLLTGTEQELEKVVVKGFMAHMGEREPLEGGLFEIGHEGRLMLVDGLGRLRGLYEPDASGQAKLVDAASRI